MSAMHRAEMMLNDLLEQSLAKLERDLTEQNDCDITCNEIEQIIETERARMTAELPAMLSKVAGAILAIVPRADATERMQ